MKKLEKFASSKIWVPSILFVSEFLYLARIHTWEVDAHHDGIILAAAVAAGEGLIPHRDFNVISILIGNTLIKEWDEV